MSTTTTPTKNQGAPGSRALESQIEPAKISGVTTQQRTARAAEERPASERTMSMMPSANDLAGLLGVSLGGGGGKKKTNVEGGGEGETAGAGEGETEGEGDGESESEGEGDGEGDEGSGNEGEGEGDGSGAGEGEGEGEGSGEGAGEGEAAGAPEEVTSLRGEVGELKTKKAELETELSAARARVAELEREGARPEPTREDPLAPILTEKELDQEIEIARNAKQWALRNPDGVEVPQGEGKEARFYSAAEVREILANAEGMLDRAGEKRAELKERATGEKFSRTIYAPFFQAGTEENAVWEKVRQAIPAKAQAALRAWRGDWETIILDGVITASVRHVHPETWWNELTGVLSKAPAKKPEGKGAAGAGASTPKVTVPAKVPPSPGGKQAPKAPAKQLEQRKRQETMKKVGGGSQRALTAAVLDRLSF